MCSIISKNYTPLFIEPKDWGEAVWITGRLPAAGVLIAVERTADGKTSVYKINR